MTSFNSCPNFLKLRLRDSFSDLPGLLSPRLRASMSDEPCIKRELESPTPKRQRLSNAQDMFDLMNQYSPPPPPPPPATSGHSPGHQGHAPYHRRRQHGSYTRWQNDRNNDRGAPRSPASRRSPYPPNHHLRRSPGHHGLRRSNRHRDRHWHGGHHHDREFEVGIFEPELFCNSSQKSGYFV